eukprot:4861268-Pleurochrysis_carterae.AAC.1
MSPRSTRRASQLRQSTVGAAISPHLAARPRRRGSARATREAHAPPPPPPSHARLRKPAPPSYAPSLP